MANLDRRHNEHMELLACIAAALEELALLLGKAA